MKYDIAKVVVECGQNYDYDLKLYKDYSGRGMYGRTTTGIEYSNTGDLIAAFILAATESEYANDDEFIDDLVDTAENLCFDQLGLNYIAY